MVSFELGREMEKDVLCLVTSQGTFRKKNSESPWGDTHYAIDVADPSSMQDARHMNFIIDLAHHGISMAQWQSVGAQNLKVWGLIPHGDSEFFSLSHACDKTKNIFLYDSVSFLRIHIQYVSWFT